MDAPPTPLRTHIDAQFAALRQELDTLRQAVEDMARRQKLMESMLFALVVKCKAEPEPQ